MSQKKSIKIDDLEESVKRVVKESLQDAATLQVLTNLIRESVANAILTELQKTIEENNKVISDLKATLETRDKKIEALENKIDDLEQYQRRQCLRIFGVAEEATEDTDKIIMEVAQRIGVDVQPQDIDRSHRVGRRDISNNRPRPIIAKFVSYRKRSEMFSNKKRLKGSGVTLREDLTAMRHNILKEAITKFGLNNVWTLDGTIIVNIGGTKRRVTRSCDLNM